MGAYPPKMRFGEANFLLNSLNYGIVVSVVIGNERFGSECEINIDGCSFFYSC
jgi:hypothetical protein